MKSFTVTYSVLVQEEDLLSYVNEKDSTRVKKVLKNLKSGKTSSDEDIDFVKGCIYDTADYYLTSGDVTPVIHESSIPELID